MPRKNKPTRKLVRSSGTGPKTGQKAGPMGSRNTRRKRTRSDKERLALAEEEESLRGYRRPGRGPNGESSN